MPFRQYIVRNLVFGLLTLAPIILTFYVAVALLNFSDTFLFSFLPEQYRPHVVLGFRVPGLGIVLTILIIFFSGLFASNYLGKKILATLELAIGRVPILNGVYGALRQFLEAIMMNRNKAFRKVIAIEYPRKGIYTLAFVTGSSANYIKEYVANEDVYTVFVPTTPNPTSGFFLVIPKSEALELTIGVDEAFRLIVSGGVLSEKKSPIDLNEGP